MILAISSGWFAFWLLVVFIVAFIVGVGVDDYYENKLKR
jgi:hypothetical protein